MIVNIRGTGGSGKSFLVNRVMDCWEKREPQFIEGRRQPIGYSLLDPKRPPLWVVGHYETPCGGCDTISGVDYIYDWVRNANDAGYNVLYEGLIVTSDVRRCIGLNKDEGRDLLVVALATHIDDCLASIQERRAAKGNKAPVNPNATIDKYNGTIVGMERIKAAGVDARWLHREEAFQAIMGALCP